MTLFAGIFSRNENQPIPDSVCDDLSRLVSRDQSDEPSVFRDRTCCLVKVDIDAFASPAFQIDKDGSVSILAGEPLLASVDNGSKNNRSKDLDVLHHSWKREDWNSLTSARGVFCAAHYQPRTNRLFLISDKLCIRPLYYWTDEKFVIFATSLRILESLDITPKVMDMQGVTELCGFGYPLGARTPYTGISLLRAAEIVCADKTNITSHRYWAWDDIERSESAEDEQLSNLHQSFNQAVSLRNGGDKATVAYLSGGLDSRCVVAALVDQNTRVHTFNFALPSTQDYVFGNDFAIQAGTIHQAVPKAHGDLTPDYSSLMARAWGTSRHREEIPAERPSVVWSGEGGSVALGHVHLGREIVDLMREGKTDEAIDAFLRQEQASVTTRLLQSKAADHLKRALHNGIREELTAINCADPARSFYLFLLVNDQRRKLASHFENIDLNRLEFQLPFFDSELLAQIISLPVDWCLSHKLYVNWLKFFSPVVTSVPWQSYPGHEPCPLPVEVNVAYQWDGAYQNEQASALKSKLLGQAKLMLKARDFPTGILKKRYLKIASTIYGFGLRDYSYVIQAAWKYFSYWNLSGGKYVLPLPTGCDESINDPTADRRFNSDAELTSSAVK